MSGWRETRLGALINITNGFAFKSVDFSESEMHNTLPIIKIKNVANGNVHLREAQHHVYSESLSKYVVKKGDVLIALTGNHPHAETQVVGLVSRYKLNNTALLNQRVAKVSSKDEDTLCTDYIYYFLKDINTHSYLSNQSSGSANQANISKSDIENIPFLLPQKDEQKAIATVLSSLDDKIDLLHRQNATLEAMAETLFRRWFVVEADGNWEDKPLSDICIIKNGFAFKSETYQSSGQKIIRTLNFSKGHIELNNLVYVSYDLAKAFEGYFLKRKDFLLVMVGAGLGNFSIVTSEILPSLQNQNMWCFRAKKPVFQHYLNFALRAIIADNLHSAGGSARSFFQKGSFYEQLIKIPDWNLIERFNDQAEAFFTKTELNRLGLLKLEQLRDTLLPRLMSGEVRVRH